MNKLTTELEYLKDNHNSFGYDTIISKILLNDEYSVHLNAMVSDWKNFRNDSNLMMGYQ